MAVTYGTIRFLKSSTQEAANFEMGLANVSTMLDDASMKYMPKYSRELDKLAVKYGEATGTLSKGLYDILSASIDAAEALDVLDISARAATAGLTDTGKAADILTTIINAYGMSAGQAEEISDILFATVKRGKTTFDELAGSMGMIVSLAATAGLSIEQVGASLATMTRAGISTDMAVTSLKGILTTFLSPTIQNIAAAKKLGLELNANTFRTIGLTGAVRKLKGATAEEIASIFTNVRALTGLSALLQMSAGFMYDLGETSNATGKMMEAFEKQIGTTQYKLDQMNEAIKSMKRSIGEQLSPAIKDWTSGVISLTSKVKNLVDALAGLMVEPELFKTDFDRFVSRMKIAIGYLTFDKEKIRLGKKELEGWKNYQLALIGVDFHLQTVDDAVLKANPDIAALDKVINDFADSVERGANGLAKFTEAEKEAAEEAKKTAEELKILAEVKFAAQFKAFEEGLKGDLFAANDFERALLALAETTHAMEESVEDFIPPSEEYLDVLEQMTKATNKVRTEIEYFGMTSIEKQLTQFEQLGKNLEGEELESFTSQLTKLRKEFEMLAGLEAGKERAEEVAKAREEELKYIDDQANAYRRLYDDIGEKSSASYANKIVLLDKEKEKYAEFITEVSLLDNWYAERKRELDRERDIASNDFFAGFKVTIDQMGDELVTWGEIGQSVAQTMKTSLTDALIEMSTAGGNWKDAMRGFALDILKVLQRMIAEMIVAKLLMTAFGIGIGGGGAPAPSTGGAGIGGMEFAGLGFSKGAAFKNGRLTKFDKGNIVYEPTIFPMANGMGLMAEKKPEAVMPLARDESGRLGVRAEGAGTTNIVKIFNIIDESQFEDYLSGGNGERVVMNIVKRNQDAGEVSY